MIRTLVSGGINWDWYLCGDFNEIDKTVEVFYHDRWHKYENRGSNHPKHESVSFDCVETDKGRQLIGVKVGRDRIEYRVTNPKQVFDYRDMTHYVSEGKS